MGLPWKIQPCYNKITKIKTQHTLKLQQEKVKQERGGLAHQKKEARKLLQFGQGQIMPLFSIKSR